MFCYTGILSMSFITETNSAETDPRNAALAVMQIMSSENGESTK